MTTVLIGIDDTDNETSRGTGHLARKLLQQCLERNMNSLGVTRHQFLLHPDIPYTSHNSGACVAVEAESAEQAAFAFQFVARHAAEGSDPGVCIAIAEDVPEPAKAFAQAATRRVLQIDQALNLAKGTSLALLGLGGNHQGVIGALASVGLRACGNDGRFIDLPGLRELPDKITPQDLTDLGIKISYQTDGRQPDPADIIHSLGWVRPRLIGGAAVLPVLWSNKENAWIPVDRKKEHPLG